MRTNVSSVVQFGNGNQINVNIPKNRINYSTKIKLYNNSTLMYRTFGYIENRVAMKKRNKQIVLLKLFFIIQNVL